MIILAIYLVGCVAAFLVSSIIILKEEGGFTVNDFRDSFMISVTSWIFVLVIVLCTLDRFLEKYKDKILFKK